MKNSWINGKKFIGLIYCTSHYLIWEKFKSCNYSVYSYKSSRVPRLLNSFLKWSDIDVISDSN